MFVLDMFSNFYLFIYFKLILIYLLTSSVVTISQSSYSPSALCFLTQRPSFDTIQFALELAQNLSFIDVFIIVDDNNYTNPLLISSTVRFLQFNETVLMYYGFHRANFAGVCKPCSAWDKALYYFSRQSTHHSFVWFIEEDVFIPSITAFLSLHKFYSSSYDLVTPDIEYNTNGNLDSWFHWPLAPGTFILPWAHGMVCAMGCSRRLLSAVNEYVQWQGQLAFIEFFFHTSAIHDNQMKVVTPVELNPIVYRYDYPFEQIQAKPYSWWHPLKNVNQQREWRSR
jgi:hypothetical protein